MTNQLTDKQKSQLDKELIVQHIRGETTRDLLRAHVKNQLLKSKTLKSIYLGSVSSDIALTALMIQNFNKSPFGSIAVMTRQMSSKARKAKRWADAINRGLVKIDAPDILKSMVYIEKADADDIARFA